MSDGNKRGPSGAGQPGGEHQHGGSGQPGGTGAPNRQDRPRGPMGGHRGPMSMMPGEKARDFKGTIGKLIKALGPYRIAVIVVLVIAAGSTVFAILGPRILGQATTELFDGVMSRIAGGGHQLPGPTWPC